MADEENAVEHDIPNNSWLIRGGQGLLDDVTIKTLHLQSIYCVLGHSHST